MSAYTISSSVSLRLRLINMTKIIIITIIIKVGRKNTKETYSIIAQISSKTIIIVIIIFLNIIIIIIKVGF